MTKQKTKNRPKVYQPTALDRLWRDDLKGKYPKEVILKALAMHDLGYSARRISLHFNGEPTESTIRNWVKQAQEREIGIPQDEINRIQAELMRLARRKAAQLRAQFGEWSGALTEDLFTIGELSARKLRDILAQEKLLFTKDELANIKQLTGTVHYVVGDVSLLTGNPTSREAHKYEEEFVSVPDIPKDELARRYRKLAEVIEKDLQTEVA